MIKELKIHLQNIAQCHCKFNFTFFTAWESVQVTAVKMVSECVSVKWDR
jgi:hypothetical protein